MTKHGITTKKSRSPASWNRNETNGTKSTSSNHQHGKKKKKIHSNGLDPFFPGWKKVAAVTEHIWVKMWLNLSDRSSSSSSSSSSLSSSAAANAANEARQVGTRFVSDLPAAAQWDLNFPEKEKKVKWGKKFFHWNLKVTVELNICINFDKNNKLLGLKWKVKSQ